jgi:hypothetical protein
MELLFIKYMCNVLWSHMVFWWNTCLS